jgi:hypothetical protein
VITTCVFVDTADVTMLNVAEIAPAGTFTDVGTPATDRLPLESDTLAPAAGAADVRVTVPIEELPPTIVAGLTFSEDRVGEGGAPPGEIRATKASPQKTVGSPFQMRSNAPGVVGKSVDMVWPVMKIAPDGPSLRSLALSEPAPPR